MVSESDPVNRITAYHRRGGLELRSGASDGAWLFAAEPIEVER